jgi:hypothetical protein
MTTQDLRGQDYRAASPYEGEAAGSGWITFAAVMLGLAGTWNLLQGILAIGSSRVYAADTVFVFSDLNTWGWIVMILGLIQLVATYAVVGGSEFGRWLGIGVACVNSIGQLYFLPANPFWALTMFAVDMLIIYALAVYGGKRMRGA